MRQFLDDDGSDEQIAFLLDCLDLELASMRPNSDVILERMLTSLAFALYARSYSFPHPTARI